MTTLHREFAWRRIGFWLSGLLGLGAVVLVVSRFGELEHLVEIERNAKPVWLIAAFALQVLTYAAAAAVWYFALRSAGAHRPLTALLAPWYRQALCGSGHTERWTERHTSCHGRPDPARHTASVMHGGAAGRPGFILQRVSGGRSHSARCA